MPSLTPGNRLYFYQLLSAGLGRGQQVTLAQAEEALDADGLAPRDVGCEAWRDLFERLDEFVRVTVFKRGRVYVTVVANETYDELLERAARGVEKSAGKAKSFKRKKGGKDLKPERPRQAPEPIAAKPGPEDEPAAKPEVELEAETFSEEHDASELQVEEQEAPEAAVGPQGEEAEESVFEPEPDADAETALEPAHEEASAPRHAPEPVPERDATSISAPEPEPVLLSAPEPEPVLLSAPEPELSTVSESAPALEPAISLTITFDPRMEGETEPAPVYEPDPPAPLTLADVPESISGDVIVNDMALSALSDVFPLGTDVLGILDEDLIQARSTHALGGTRALIELPLRFALPGGDRLCVRLKRKAPNRAGKRWSLQVPEDLPETGVDGLPDVGLWPWSKLPTARLGVRPYVELARSVETGSWDELLESLKQLVPSEHMTAAQLAATVASAFMDNAIIASPDGREAAFALPVATGASTPVAVRLEAQNGAIPWCVTGLVAAETLPEPLHAVWPAAHMTTLEQLMVRPGSTLDLRFVCAGDPDLEAGALRSFMRAQIRPRSAVAAFDPIGRAPMLLLPLGQEVLAIAPRSEQSYQALAILTREEAHAIACV